MGPVPAAPESDSSSVSGVAAVFHDVSFYMYIMASRYRACRGVVTIRRSSSSSKCGRSSANRRDDYCLIFREGLGGSSYCRTRDINVLYLSGRCSRT